MAEVLGPWRTLGDAAGEGGRGNVCGTAEKREVRLSQGKVREDSRSDATEASETAPSRRMQNAVERLPEDERVSHRTNETPSRKHSTLGGLRTFNASTQTELTLPQFPQNSHIGTMRQSTGQIIYIKSENDRAQRIIKREQEEHSPWTTQVMAPAPFRTTNPHAATKQSALSLQRINQRLERLRRQIAANEDRLEASQRLINDIGEMLRYARPGPATEAKKEIMNREEAKRARWRLVGVGMRYSFGRLENLRDAAPRASLKKRKHESGGLAEPVKKQKVKVERVVGVKAEIKDEDVHTYMNLYVQSVIQGSQMALTILIAQQVYPHRTEALVIGTLM